MIDREVYRDALCQLLIRVKKLVPDGDVHVMVANPTEMLGHHYNPDMHQVGAILYVDIDFGEPEHRVISRYIPSPMLELPVAHFQHYLESEIATLYGMVQKHLNRYP